MKKIALFLIVFLSACGFRGIYSDPEYGQKDIKIEMARDLGQNNRTVEAKYFNLLHKELNIKKNFSESDYQYLVKLNLKWYETGSLRKGSGSLSRKDVVLLVQYRIETKDGEILEIDEIKTIDSLDISKSRFTNYSLENFVLDNLVGSSVSDLKNKIITIISMR